MTEFTTDQSPVPYIQKISALQIMLESLCQAIGIDHETKIVLSSKKDGDLGEYTIEEALQGASQTIDYLKSFR